jgi:hypothetical protein
MSALRDMFNGATGAEEFSWRDAKELRLIANGIEQLLLEAQAKTVAANLAQRDHNFHERLVGEGVKLINTLKS